MYVITEKDRRLSKGEQKEDMEKRYARTGVSQAIRSHLFLLSAGAVTDRPVSVAFGP
jgi:hypothetical protein